MLYTEEDGTEIDKKHSLRLVKDWKHICFSLKRRNMFAKIVHGDRRQNNPDIEHYSRFCQQYHNSKTINSESITARLIECQESEKNGQN